MYVEIYKTNIIAPGLKSSLQHCYRRHCKLVDRY